MGCLPLDSDFTGDMEGLLRAGVAYDQAEAFVWISENIIEKLR